MKDKKKIKRRTYLDIGKREKAKDYKDKRTKDGERFQENIVEKKSKLNNFEREIKSTDKKGGLSLSQKQIEKHRAKEERTGDSNNLEKITTESRQVKEVIIEEKNLDIGARVKTSNYLGKRVHEKDRFDESIIKKKTKLKHSQVKTSVKKNEIAEDKEDIVGGDRNLLDSLNDKSINKNKRKTNKYGTPDKETKSNDSLKEDAENPNISGKDDEEIKADAYEETSYDLEVLNKNGKVSNKNYYKRKAIYASQKKTNKRKDGKLTTDDVKGLKDGMDNRTDEKSLKENITLSEKSEKKYRKTESRLIHKGKKASKLYHKSKYSKTGKLLGGISGASYLTSEYMRAGSDENVAIDAANKGLYLNANMTRHAQNRLQRKRKSPLKVERKLDLNHKKNMAKAEYNTEVEALKKDQNFQKKSAYKKLIKRKQMKKKIYEEHNIAVTFKDRLKRGIENILKGSSQVIRRNIRRLLILLAVAIIGFMTLSQIATFFIGGISSVTSQVMSTTYLSGEETLADINSEFTNYEYELADELANIESYYPGYDEYHVGGNTDIGHGIHELLSFITAKHGEVTNVSSLSGELKNLFNNMYKVNYETIVETRYRQVCYGSGEDRYCVMEPYDWHVLKVTVTKKEMDTVAREEFDGYEENLAHYEALLETGGNMEEYFGGSGITPVIPDSTIIGELVNNPNLSDKEKALVLAAYRTPTAGGGYCAAWVSNVYVNAGYPRPGGNANDQYYWYCNSNDLSELRPGMMVAVPTHNHTQAGKKYGHVGIYVGNGVIRENIGIVKDTKLSDWIAYYGSSAKWGFPY
ncbi:hypothetical protein KPL33_12350 [Clostridium algidicarnis]|uniref:CD1108 family mobile element protein n=1 Tax=Clostridium algidicarnis TaxID=37659 RepID=UPI001C0B4EBA|nr:hypothetical protein [Clostridium algidicarnis]MBU3207759.1 hypothetical protein [Clostridium algidicarnis]